MMIIIHAFMKPNNISLSKAIHLEEIQITSLIDFPYSILIA
jgi:hypothetical protein